LLEKGYEVYNITSALPTNSIESYLNNIKFGLLLISVTLEENLDSVTWAGIDITNYYFM